MALPRRLVVLASASALVVGLAGCASKGSTEAVELTVENFAQTIAAAQSQIDPVSCTFELSVTALGTTMSSTGAMRATEDGVAEMSMTMDLPDVGSVDMLMVDGAVYMNMGELTGGKWFVIDIDDPSLGLDQMPEVDPVGDAQDLQPALISVTKVGEPEVVDGVEVQEYEVVVEPAKVGGDMKKQMDESWAQLEEQGIELPTELTYHYFLGADGLMRRVSVEMLDGLSTEMTFADWGQPVDIEAPPASETIALP